MTPRSACRSRAPVDRIVCPAAQAYKRSILGAQTGQIYMRGQRVILDRELAARPRSEHQVTVPRRRPMGFTADLEEKSY
jgi:hypothetical protein